MSGVDRNRWKQIEALFKGALAIAEASERSAYLRDQCAGDVELLQELETLLQARDGAGSVLEGAIEREAVSLLESGDNELLGSQLGSYRLEEEIGEGGMSRVYRATRVDDEFDFVVAIKVIKRGMDTTELVRRFRAERQILAGLEHPNIARILDGGTTVDGRPYFVMDYVDGKPIDIYCQEQQLTLRERITLFIEVCDAVQYAHQNLVVHRDVKPANILVTGDGRSVLLDFGIAKVLADDDGERDLTHIGLRPMSLGFASPEQVRGERLTTASDVYALGVVLYLLLTGKRPYRVSTRPRHDVERVICHEVPPRPSTVLLESAVPVDRSDARTWARALEGDLDWVVGRALEKEPARRYRTARELSHDLQRYLDREPVHARPPSRVYRMRKFVQRNPLLATSLVAIVVTVIISLASISVLYVQASRAKSEAERRYGEVRALVDALIFEIHDEIAPLPGSTPVREKLVERALRYLESLRRDPGGEVDLRREVGHAYFRIADVQGHPAGPNLGDTEGALQSYALALDAFRSLSRDYPDDAEVARMVASVLDKIGEVSHVIGRTAHASDYFAEAFDIRRRLIADSPDVADNRSGIARSHNRAGLIAAVSGHLADAMAHYRQAIEIEEQLVAERPDDEVAKRSRAVNWMWLATIQVEHGELEDGLRNFERSIAMFEALRSAHPENVRLARDLSVNYGRYVGALLRADRTEDAIRWTETSQRMNREIMAADPFNVDARRQLALGFQRHGAILARTERLDEAVVAYEEARSATERLRDDDPENQNYRRDLWVLSYRVASLRHGQARYDDAMAEARVGDALCVELLTSDPENASFREFQAQNDELIARVALAVADPDVARIHLTAARLQYEELLGRDPENTRFTARLARVKASLDELSTDHD